MVALGRMFPLAIRAEMLTTKPPMPTITVRNTRKGFFESDELARVLEHLPEDLRPAIEFASITGCRISEVRKLVWSQVDGEGGVLRLEPGTTKNDQGRTWPFSTHPRLATLLYEQLDRAEAWQRAHQQIVPWIFQRDGRQLGEFKRSWKTACKLAGCPDRLVHDLRRTAVRNLVRAGVTERVAMQLTGHKTRSVFDRYDIVNEADLKAAAAKLAQSS
jgi:integrase